MKNDAIKIEELEQENFQLKEALKELKKLHSDSRETILRLGDEIKGLKEELSESQEAIAYYSDQNVILKNKLELAKIRIKTLEGAYKKEEPSLFDEVDEDEAEFDVEEYEAEFDEYDEPF
jgi:chromosome segregation ATPase